MGFILTELIEALCPDGVVYKRIGDIAEVGTGSSNGNEAVDNGVYPFFVRSQTIKAKDDYEYDEEAIIIPGEGGIGEIFHYVNGKYALHQRVYRIHFLTKDVNVKFAYYYMQANFKSFILKKAVSATVTSIRKPMVEGFPLPMPPAYFSEAQKWPLSAAAFPFPADGRNHGSHSDGRSNPEHDPAQTG